MKFVYLIVALVFMGCTKVQPPAEEPLPVAVPKNVEVPSVKKVMDAKKLEAKKAEVKKEAAQTKEVFEEPKTIKRVGGDIPTSCFMWSDGCNVCTKVGDGTKASCTTNECSNKMFSCLQWY